MMLYFNGLFLPFNRSCKIPLILKVTTFRAPTSAAFPVFGFRPGRAAFWRTRQMPKPDSFISSPRSRCSRMIFKTHVCGSRRFRF